jgi:protein-S-isoprenylcysteine O-methyltransferase Ste14
VHRIFNQPKLRSTLLMVRLPLALAGCVCLVFWMEPGWFWPCFAISAVGALAQGWCFAALRKTKVLAARGPYLLVRNPMYLARYVLILGLVLLPGKWWLAVGVTLFYYFYMVNRVGREEVKLREVFGEEYLRYCADVRRFVPSFRRFSWGELWFFRWDYFMKNNGYRVILGTLAFYAVCYAVLQLRK